MGTFQNQSEVFVVVHSSCLRTIPTVVKVECQGYVDVGREATVVILCYGMLTICVGIYATVNRKLKARSLEVVK